MHYERAIANKYSPIYAYSYPEERNECCLYISAAFDFGRPVRFSLSARERSHLSKPIIVHTADGDGGGGHKSIEPSQALSVLSNVEYSPWSVQVHNIPTYN